MTNIIISRSKFNGNNPFINGREFVLPRDTVFDAPAGLLEVLDGAEVPYDLAPPTGALTGNVVITRPSPHGDYVPLTINGKTTRLQAGIPLPLSAAQIEALTASGVPFTYERTDAVSTILRTRDYLMYGSSTYGSTGNAATTDGRGNPVPLGSRGMVLQVQIMSLIPTATGKVVSNITVPQYVGNPNNCSEDIRRKVIVDRDAGTLTGKGMFFGTPNMWLPTATIEQPVAPETTRDTAGQLKATMEALDGTSIPRFCMYTFQIHSSFGNTYSAIKTRLEKISKARGPRLVSGFSSFDEAYVRELPAQAVQDDVNAQLARYRGMGWTNASDYAHSNGEGYRVYANYMKLPINTIEGGLPFISPWHYHKYLAAAGKIATVVTMGELLGCTFTLNDEANFSLLLVDNPSYPGADQPQKVLELYLTATGAAARPIKAPHELTITVSKPGYGSETFRISVAIQRRAAADNTPQKVVLKQSALWFQGFEDDMTKPYFPNTRHFTMFMMVRMDPFDGNQLQFTEAGAGVGYLTANPTAGSSDGAVSGSVNFVNIEKAPGTAAFSIRRTGVNAINVVAQDDLGATCFNVTTTGTLTQDHGWRMLSIHYDADQPAKCKVRLSEGRFISSGLDYAAQTTAITPGGTGTLGLGLFRTSPTPFSQMRLIQNGTTLPTMFFPCTIWRWIMTPHFIEDTAPNLAALWQPARATGPVAAAALALSGGGSTLDGVNFTLDLRGDAAEWCSGLDDTDWMDEENGARKCKNFGTGPGLNITTPRAVEFEAVG